MAVRTQDFEILGRIVLMVAVPVMNVQLDGLVEILRHISAPLATIKNDQLAVATFPSMPHAVVLLDALAERRHLLLGARVLRPVLPCVFTGLRGASPPATLRSKIDRTADGAEGAPLLRVNLTQTMHLGNATGGPEVMERPACVRCVRADTARPKLDQEDEAEPLPVCV